MVSGHDNLAEVLEKSSEIGLDRELASRSYEDFFKMAWDEVEPSRPLLWNWHISAICDHLQAVHEGEIRRLVINVPPGTGKSLACCVFLPAWIWSQDPRKKFIFASYSDKIALRDSKRCKRLLESEWYKERWGNKFELFRDDRAAGKYANNKGGFRMATTVRGGVTGEHADIQVVDDATKPLEVTKSLHVAKTALDEVHTWWSETMSSRLVDFEKSARVIIMQRLHENDLAGHVLKEGGYEHLMLPMEYESKRKCYTSIGFEDPRTKEGELLFPERFSSEAVEQTKRELGSRGAHAQLQQNPTPAEGSIIKAHWAKYYSVMPKKFNMLIQSWDCTFKDGDTNDYVVGQVWGVIDSEYYLVDQIRERMGFVDTCKAIKALTLKYPKARYKVVEDKANGPAVVDALRKQIPGFKLVNPEGGKVARVHAVEPIWESGNVFLPSPELAPWVHDPDGFMDEVTGFPARMHDDQVDAMSQALIFLETKSLGRLRALRKL